MLTSLTARFRHASPELKLFAGASLVFGMAYSIFDSVFNNYLNASFSLTGFQRSFLEFPRELPGFLAVFATALVWFLSSRRLGALSLVLGVVGSLLIGFASTSYPVMVLWLFIYSLGNHLLMPVATTIGMELARDGATGARLGQLNALRNLATILGSFIVFIGFRYLSMTFQHSFAIVAVLFAISAFLMFRIRPEKAQKPNSYLKLHREYRTYYLLAILFGSRKQLFFTFAPWVIVNIYDQPTQTLATLLTIGGIIGIIFQPILGRAIDRLGERTVLAAEAVMLVFVCLLYGFSGSLFAPQTAFYITCVCYLMDQILFSVGIARSTYLKKIALHPGDIQPALTTALTIDHIFSIGIALVGGVVWSTLGYQYVFLIGVAIAAINFFVALSIRIPVKTGAPAAPAQAG